MKVTVTDNSRKYLSALQFATLRGLEALGVTAEGHAKKKLTREVYTGNKPYKLTGRLRNSVTYAVSGQRANIQSYSGDHGGRGGTNTGTAPKEKNLAG